jgi:hypothetical protein
MSIEKAILPIKINELVSLISAKKKLDTTDAMSYLYSSAFYKKLFDTKSKWWYLSGLNLYLELEKEKQKLQKMDGRHEKEQMFYVFCAENYRILKKMEGVEVLLLFKKYDVHNFLSENYDVLHSQSEDYILNEISAYIKNQKRK